MAGRFPRVPSNFVYGMTLFCVLMANSVAAQLQAPEMLTHSGSSSSTTANDAALTSGTFTLGLARMSSDNGRFVVLLSKATDMIAGQSDSNGAYDVFLLDRSTGNHKLVSHTAGSATQACNAASTAGSISGDGAWVVFYSAATDLVAGVTDTNAQNDVFLFETATGNVTLLSRSAASATTTANNFSHIAQISVDGRYVTFVSGATDLITGQVDANAQSDLFLHDRVTGITKLVSHVGASSVTTGNDYAVRSTISEDSTIIAFTSKASDLISGGTDTNAAADLFCYEISSGNITLASHAPGSPLTAASGTVGNASGCAISADGKYVLFSHTGASLVAGQTDTNTVWDVFLYDRTTNTNRLVSHLPGSAIAASTTTTPAASSAPPPPPPQPTVPGMLSADGRYAAYAHKATDLITGQTGTGYQIYLYDRVTDSNILVSHASGSATVGISALTGGITGDVPLISADGRFVTFPSMGTGVVSGVTDANANADIFLFDRMTGNNLLVSRAASSGSVAGNNASTKQFWSRNGALVHFMTAATDLGGTDSNGQTDFYGVSLAGLIASVNPPSAGTGGGVAVTLSGKGFIGTTAVRFGGVAATGVVVVSESMITCVIPAHAAGSVAIELDSAFLTVSYPAAFTYLVAPTLTSVAPATGPATGGTNVTLTGTSFIGASSVTFGGSAAMNVTVVNNTTITCTTPAHAAGTVSVIVTTPVGSNVSNSLFTYSVPPAPTVNGVTPSTGLTTGGTSTIITGTNFFGTVSVTFGGSAATNVVVTSTTTIACTTPAHAPGSVSVLVTTTSGANPANSLFTYTVPAPTIASVSPGSGPTAGGTAITITGADFTGATSVTLGGSAATNLVVMSATSINCTTPAHAAGAVSVIVTTPSGANPSNTLFTYITPAPTVSSVSPNNGPITGNTSVTITGTGFTGTTSVAFGGSAAASVVIASATSITCITPAHAAGAVSVIVTTPAGSNAANTAFTYVTPASPTVTGVAPASGPTAGGTTVSITGTTFTGATQVTFGGSPATNLVLVSATQISCTTPAHAAGLVSVVVFTPGGSNPGNTLFNYVAPAPVVASVTPNTGSTSGGAAVTITGSDFVGATGVIFGGSAATGIVVVNAATITCIIPAHAAGAVSVTVTTASGTGVGNLLFTFVTPPAAQEIEISRSSVILVDGSGENLPGTQAGSPVTLTYAIKNLGALDLTLPSLVGITNSVNCTVTVLQQPTMTIVGGGMSNLSLGVTPSGAGAYSFDIGIVNNDSDENPFNWTAAGVASPSMVGGQGGSASSGGGGGGCSAGTGNSLATLILLLLGVASMQLRRRGRKL